MICWWVYSLLLLAAGDVEFNPGPTENLNLSLGQVTKFKNALQQCNTMDQVEMIRMLSNLCSNDLDGFDTFELTLF